MNDHSPTYPSPRFGIYVHWPFCLAKCPYCDFNSHVRARIDDASWRQALLQELSYYAAQTSGRTVDTIFFGGGTPSLIPPVTVGAVLEEIADLWDIAPNCEITLEANPTSVEATRFAGLRAAGVNRLSLGIQALDDSALKFLGREHSADEALAAISLAQQHFTRFSFDLIYARPDQTPAAWQAELNRALSLTGDHLSVYQLTLEPGTHFYTRARQGNLHLPDEDTQAALYEMTQDTLNCAGMAAYEISNHAVPGGECRHNLLYWQYGEYVGVGPGAHGRLRLSNGTRKATQQRRLPEAWAEAVAQHGHGTEGETILGTDERLVEMMTMGLRLSCGIAAQSFIDELSLPLEKIFPFEKLQPLISGGFLIHNQYGLRATPAGRQRLNAVLQALLT